MLVLRRRIGLRLGRQMRLTQNLWPMPKRMAMLMMDDKLESVDRVCDAEEEGGFKMTSQLEKIIQKAQVGCLKDLAKERADFCNNANSIRAAIELACKSENDTDGKLLVHGQIGRAHV